MTKRQAQEIEALISMRDDEIDTSDIPEVNVKAQGTPLLARPLQRPARNSKPRERGSPTAADWGKRGLPSAPLCRRVDVNVARDGDTGPAESRSLPPAWPLQ